MDEKNAVLSLIKEKGYITKTDLYKKVGGDKEIIKISLNYLIESGEVLKIQFVRFSPDKEEDNLYYIPSK